MNRSGGLSFFFSIMTILILRALLGVFCLLGLLWLCSVDRKAVNWRLIGGGLLLQLLLAQFLDRFVLLSTVQHKRFVYFCLYYLFIVSFLFNFLFISIVQFKIKIRKRFYSPRVEGT
jgi:hypothetical protein